jgi:hypothetical protein
VPYHPQSLEFTCGPACLMMALRSLGHAEPLGQGEELALWREATTVFMLAGHGGASAHGLAVAALRRGFGAEVWVDQPGAPFLDTVRSPAKKRVIELTHAGFEEELARRGGQVRLGDFTADDVVEQLAAGRVPLVLVSGASLYAERIPHWVVATGWDDDHLYVHDPHLPEGAQRADGVHLPLRRATSRGWRATAGRATGDGGGRCPHGGAPGQRGGRLPGRPRGAEGPGVRRHAGSTRRRGSAGRWASEGWGPRPGSATISA